MYTKFVELDSPIRHAKFQVLWMSGSREEYFLCFYTIYEHGGHLGHVTMAIYTNFRSPFQWKLHMKFGFDVPSDFGEDLRKW